jgi:ADP-heptose:LPS heptosyltransferase
MKSVVFVQNRDFFGARLIHVPLLYSLKEAYTDNEIIVFSPFESAHFFRDVGLASEVIVYSYGLLRMRRNLKRLRPDLIISFRPGSEWLNLAIGLSGAKQRLSFRTLTTRMMFTHTIKRDISVYRALDFLKVLEPIGISSKPGLFFWEQSKQGTIRLPDARNTFCLIPGGGSGEFKRWGIRNFIQLGERLKERYRTAAFIFILGEAEEHYIKEIRSASIVKDSKILFNETVANCARAVAGGRITIANDCGPAQIAQMMNVPYVGIFSNYDGKAKGRIAEWFFPHKNAQAVTTEKTQDIKSIPVECIENAVSQLLTKSD